MIESSQYGICERLYLERENGNEIFINNSQLLKQHQIDGVRFLFKQFKKGKPVVIVNFPPECGKSVTVALFLKAISNLLKKPILIICNNEDEIEHWKETILKWTEYNIDDIAIDATNVYIKKKIFIKNSVDCTLSYQRPNWSIVIMKEDINKNILKLSFNAELKIWITSADVKKDLQMLAFVYNWLLPESKTKPTMNYNNFTPHTNKLMEKVEKAILLDSFVEGFLIQETDIEMLEEKQESNISNTDTSKNKEHSLQKSRKNKDSTGTKIKRSKRKFDDEIITESNKNEKVNKNSHEINVYDNEINVNDEEDMESQNILLDYDNVIENNMDVHVTEHLSVENAKDIVKNENISEKSTESIDFDEIQAKTCDKGSVEKQNLFDGEGNVDCNESVQHNANNSDHSRQYVHNIIQDKNGEENQTKHDFNMTNSTKNNKKESNEKQNNLDGYKIETDDKVLEKTAHEDAATEKVKKSHKDVDDISEWEEKTLKKFKGSLLDSIF